MAFDSCSVVAFEPFKLASSICCSFGVAGVDLLMSVCVVNLLGSSTVKNFSANDFISANLFTNSVDK